MIFFHLSDLHIGLKLFNRDLREDQEYILKEIVRKAREVQPDAVVIAGDVYDKAVPSAEAVDLFDAFISGLAEAIPKGEIMIISGNHDSGSRLNVFRSVLSKRQIHMIGLPPRSAADHVERVQLKDNYGPVNFYLLPFVKPSMVKQIVGTDEKGNNLSYDETLRRLLGREEVNTEERNVLVSHQFYLPVGTRAESVERMDSEIRTVGNIDEVRADVLERFDYAALGHIHKPMQAGCDRWRYCGTPLPCSVSEAGQEKGIIQVELGEKGRLETKVLPLVPLRQVRVIRGTLEEVLSRACSDYVTAVLTGQTDQTGTDIQDRLRCAFPYLLEIRREVQRRSEGETNYPSEKIPEILDLCRLFLSDLDGEEQALLQDVISTVQEVQ